MLLIFEKHAAGIRWQLFKLFVLISLLLNEPATGFGNLYEGDACELKTRQPGLCKLASQCTALKIAIKNREIAVNDVINCGLGIREEIICCPVDSSPTLPPRPTLLTMPPTTQPRIGFPIPFTPNNIPIPAERPAIAACNRFFKDAPLEFIKHVLDGTPVQLGEYPHMAAIGYIPIGNDVGNNANRFILRCGGTLIEDRFVLTAAHCVNRVSLQPQMVRLGFVDFKNEEQMQNSVEIPIKHIHVHPNYSNNEKTHDIAVLELEYPCEFSDYIRPTCLHTDIVDPPRESRLFVTGWGYVSTNSRKTSDILFKAQVEIEDLKSCSLQYLKDNITLNSGHLCAIDRNFTKDACQADSGGPLNLIVNENKKKYSVVGVISAGYSCATSTPGLYARVANYVDFIEKIVWP